MVDWSSPEFAAEARAWCAGVLGPLTSMDQHKLRPWGTVWRLETADGVWFFKQGCPGQAYEPAVQRLLAEVAPEHVVPVRGDAPAYWLSTLGEVPPLV
jgi:hypothetical protein